MKPAPKRLIIPARTPLLSRSETIRMAVMVLVLLVIIGAMLNLKASWKAAEKAVKPGAGSGVNVRPTYVVPARSAPEPTTVQADPDPPGPRLSDDQEITYQLNRDEVLEGFSDLVPVARNATWWTLAARVQAFGYSVLSRMTPKGPDLARCIREPDTCRGDVIRFKAKILASEKINPPPDCKGAPSIHVVRVLVTLPEGPREALLDVPADILTSPPAEETPMAGIFVGFLPPPGTAAATPGAEVSPEEASSKGIPYLIGLIGSESLLATTPPPPPVAPASRETPVPAPPPAPAVTAPPPPAVAPAPGTPPPGPPAAPAIVRFEGMLNRISHDGKYVQDEAYNYFIRAITTTDAATVKKQVDPSLTAGALIADPQGKSGEFVRIRGTLLSIDHQGLDTNPTGLRDSYLAYVLDRDENITIVHLFLKKPPTYKKQEDYIEVEGLYLKLLHYETQKTSRDNDWRMIRKSPLVLANETGCRIWPITVPETSGLDAIRIFFLVGVGGLFLAGGAWALIRRQDRSYQMMLDEARKQKKNAKPGPASPPSPAGAPEPPSFSSSPPAPPGPTVAGSGDAPPAAPPPAPGTPPTATPPAGT